MAPIGYTWVPYSLYVVKPRGSRVSLVPIPKLKLQQSVSMLKMKKSETKKSEVKTKKVASISFLFFILLFGGLVPFLNVESVAVEFSSGESDTYNRVTYEKGRIQENELELEWKGQQPQPLSGSNEYVHLENVSEALVASLHMPRNDKLVKIDGNLIIYFVLYIEKAMTFQDTFRKKNNRETSLAIPINLALALAIPESGGSNHDADGGVAVKHKIGT
ncbi:bZIP transcription factor 17-like [Carya illinoinensis]|uniref:bZIP transcription factor 17-like n=1 Tax=Carya illinoinensis TaxID=32201 RepID=UPI001C71A592|nr:bZIP transcription factor 17-like [Carya illinoinensis]